ncbi:MAG: hypothetical protein WA767_00995, partial [Pseudolabrys sp.]
ELFRVAVLRKPNGLLLRRRNREHERQREREPRQKRGTWFATPESPQVSHRDQGTPTGLNGKTIVGADVSTPIATK